MKFELQFAPDEIEAWSKRYGADEEDREAFRVGAVARATGEISRDDFLAIAKWKTRRSGSRCRLNSEAYVRQATSSALTASDPRFKIEVLRLLDGVEWSTASVILHFCDADEWPILDFRALWSLGQPTSVTYGFRFWEGYTTYARELARSASVNMRTLDRALWAFSKVNQAPGRTVTASTR